jgi:hypothetical protein
MICLRLFNDSRLSLSICAAYSGEWLLVFWSFLCFDTSLCCVDDALQAASTVLADSLKLEDPLSALQPSFSILMRQINFLENNPDAPRRC